MSITSYIFGILAALHEQRQSGRGQVVDAAITDGVISLMANFVGHIARGSFREVVPVHRLAYSFGWDGSDEVPPGSSLIEIDLIDKDSGTLMRMTHSGLPNEAQCASHERGWAHYLGRLTERAAGRDPGPDRGASQKT